MTKKTLPTPPAPPIFPAKKTTAPASSSANPSTSTPTASRPAPPPSPALIKKMQAANAANAPKVEDEDDYSDDDHFDSGEAYSPKKDKSKTLSSEAALSTTASTSAEYELCSWLLRLDIEQMPIAQAICDRLKPNDFYETLFKQIYLSAYTLIKEGKISAPASVLDYAHQHNLHIQAADLAVMVEDVLSQSLTAERLQQNVDIVLDHSQRRAMRLMLLDKIEQLNTQSAQEVKADLEKDLAQYNSLESADTAPQHISDIMGEVINDLDPSEEKQSSVVSTGLVDLDRKLGGGLREADYVVLGGRPSMGKTALALIIGRNMSMDTRHRCNVLVYSLEMPGKALAQRLLSAEAAIPLKDLRIGGAEILENNSYVSSLFEVMPRFSDPNSSEKAPHTSRLWIDDQAGLNISQITSRTREFIRKHGKTIVIIDYIQFISTSDLKGISRNEQVSIISRGIKNLAKETNSPIIALSQLSRDLEKRVDKRPIMSDLRESGAIEQDADIIGFIYRDVVYHPELADDPTKAELILAKQRQGELGTVNLNFNAQYARFSSYSSYEY